MSRRLLQLAIVFAGATCLWASAASAQSPTPTSVDTATPSAYPTPTVSGTPVIAGYSTITVRFLHQGQPLILDTLPPTGEAYADGQDCSFYVKPTPMREALTWVTGWPQLADPPACSQVGTLVRICFPEAGCAETRWQGVNTTVDLEVPDRPGASLVTARFVRDGQMIAVTPTDWSYQAGAEICSKSVVTTPLSAISSASRFWPPFGTAAGSPCAAGGSSVEVRFTSEEYGAGAGMFTWSGASLAFDVTFGPSPGSLPAGLPNTGSAPADTGSHFPISLAVFVAAILAAASLILFKRSGRARR